MRQRKFVVNTNLDTLFFGQQLYHWNTDILMDRLDLLAFQFPTFPFEEILQLFLQRRIEVEVFTPSLTEKGAQMRENVVVTDVDRPESPASTEVWCGTADQTRAFGKSEVSLSEREETALMIAEQTARYRKQILADMSSNRVVSVSEVDEKEPSFSEMQSTMSTWRTTIFKLPHFQQFMENGKLTLESKAIWEIIVDLYQTLIMFGYCPIKRTLRDTMIKQWLTHCYRVQYLPMNTTIVLPADWCFQDTPQGFQQIHTFEYINEEIEWLVDNTDYVPKPEEIITKFITEPQSFTIPVSRWMKYIKYKLGAFAAAYKDNNEFPKSPLPKEVNDKPDQLFDSVATKWLKSQRALLRKNDPTFNIWYMSLIDSIARGVKKGAPRATLNDCLKNDLETLQCFSGERPTIEDLKVRDMTLNEGIIYDVIDRTLNDLDFENLDFQPKFNLCPSFSSCTENTTSKGGHVPIVKASIPKWPNRPIIREETVLLTNPRPITNINITGIRNPTVSQCFDIEDQEIVSDYTEKKFSNLRSARLIRFSNQSEPLGSDIDPEELSELVLREQFSSTRLLSLLEALKTRGISTPAALETWLLKPLQETISKHISKYPIFQATRETLSSDLLNRVFPIIYNDEYFLSGDYDNATNKIHGRFSEYVIKSICKKMRLSEKYSEVAIRSLCRNEVEYKFPYFNNNDIYSDFPESNQIHRLKAKQLNAQPMGKVLSFVCLCILNLSIVRLAQTIDFRKDIKQQCDILYNLVPINKMRCLINGDDIAAPFSDFKIWEKVTFAVGLENSIGKTFFSKNFIEMNSRTFIVDKAEEFSDFRLNLKYRETPFINFGLLKCRIRSVSAETEDNHEQMFLQRLVKIGPNHQKLMTAFPDLYDDLHFLFRRYNNEILLDPLLKDIPYFIPSWLGGLGMHPGALFWETISSKQLRCCSRILSNIRNKPPQILSVEKDVALHDIINKKMKLLLQSRGISDTECQQIAGYLNAFTYDDQFLDLEKENEIVYKQMIEETWRDYDLEEFFSNPTFSTLKKNIKNKRDREDYFEKLVQKRLKYTKNKIKLNTKLWKQAYAYNEMYKELKWFKLWHRPQPETLPFISFDFCLDNSRKYRENEPYGPFHQEQFMAVEHKGLSVGGQREDSSPQYTYDIEKKVPPVSEEDIQNWIDSM